MKPRYLTKSRFKVGHECPTKLYYGSRPKEYANQNLDDPFLKSLAEGGHQVGALAQVYFPGGRLIETLDYDQALSQTAELLRNHDAIIYEAAFQYKNLFLRADVVVKRGSHIELFEVKATSYAPDERFWQQKKPYLLSDWEPYLFDIAFQTFVMRNACPDFTIEPYLFLVDKAARCPTDALHQKFLITRDRNGRAKVVARNITPEDTRHKLLIAVPVNDEVEKILEGSATEDQKGELLEKEIERLADIYSKEERVDTPLSSACKTCEFVASESDLTSGLKSGLDECWKKLAKLSAADLSEPKILDLWDFRKTNEAIENKRFLLRDLKSSDIESKSKKKDDEEVAGLSRVERQSLQIEYAKSGKTEAFIDKDGLRSEFKKLKYPLHFIDFETTAPAIPFHRGMRPYEGIAFQFSHHVLHKNGKIEHRGQFLHSEPGAFPNFDFARALKKELETDDGSVLRYATHENTYLNFIINQLDALEEPGRENIIEFLRTITEPTKANSGAWRAPRAMVDMLKWVKKYYYHPKMGGSNSIKYVLPAVLGSSKYLQEKYSKPIYGKGCEIPSLNFEPHIWVKRDSTGVVIDPYKQLPPLFNDYDERTNSILLFEDEKIANGGSAMVAWARMQFTEMSVSERSAISSSLLKYCELDTLAMAMIFEAWREEIIEEEI